MPIATGVVNDVQTTYMYIRILPELRKLRSDRFCVDYGPVA